MNSQTDPNAVRLREALPSLQLAVAEGSMTPLEANKALGRIADAITPPTTWPAAPKRKR